MKQFLRFQISGGVCLFWTLLFFIPYVDWANVAAQNLVTILIGSITLALPLGVIIHQISISLLSPFGKRRLPFLSDRRGLNELKGIKEENESKKYHSTLAIVQGTKFKEIDIEYFRQAIENRYSYYYVRIDNGLFAPLFAFGIFFYVKSALYEAEATFLRQEPLIYAGIVPIILICIFVNLLVLCYILDIFEEIDDIEHYLLLCYENGVDERKASQTEGGEQKNSFNNK